MERRYCDYTYTVIYGAGPQYAQHGSLIFISLYLPQGKLTSFVKTSNQQHRTRFWGILVYA